MVAERRKKQTRTTDWGWRLSGLALCAFFAFGVLAGLSAAHRAGGWDWAAWLGPILHPHALRPAALAGLAEAPVALVERKDGFYALGPAGELRGPLSPQAAGDLPVLSGPGLDNADGDALLEDAALAVRAEAMLAQLVSELRVGRDGIATLYLERSRTELILDRVRSGAELARAASLMRRWQAHLDLISALDMTTPGEAVVRLRKPFNVVLEQMGSAVSKGHERIAEAERARARELASR